MKRHLVKFINENGDASALCFDEPRPIDLKKETWTNRKDKTIITCKRCLIKMGGGKPLSFERDKMAPKKECEHSDIIELAGSREAKE